jgi:hypothetical protein
MDVIGIVPDIQGHSSGVWCFSSSTDSAIAVAPKFARKFRAFIP